MSPFRLALLTLQRKPLSTWIAIASIALAVASSGLLVRLYLLSQSRFASMAPGPEALVGAKTGGIEMLLNALNGEGSVPGYVPYALYESLKAQETPRFSGGVTTSTGFLKSIAPFVYFGKAGSAKVIGTDAGFFDREDPRQKIEFAQGQWSEDPGSIVLGSQVAAQTGLKIGDTTTVNTWTGDDGPLGPSHNMKVVGILKSTGVVWDRDAFSNIATAQGALSQVDLGSKSIWGPKVLNYYFIELKPQGGPALQNLIDNRTVGQAVFVEKARAQLQDLAGAGQDLGLSLTILILILGGLCVAAMLISRFDGMATQIAVLRALGYQKSFLIEWLVLEGLLIGAIACLIGGTLDAGLFPILRATFGSALPDVNVAAAPIWQSWIVWAVALFTTALAVVFPIWRLQRQSLHQSLRG